MVDRRKIFSARVGIRPAGILVHDATIRALLVIRAPGVRADSPIRAAVSLIDVLPTILAFLDLPCPKGVQGRDLGPLMRGAEVPWGRASGYAESLYAELHHGCAPLRALREGGFKLVRGRVEELYDLAADPGEVRDLSTAEPARAAGLSASLASFVADLETGDSETVTLDDEALRALQSLGYLWASSSRFSSPPP